MLPSPSPTGARRLNHTWICCIALGDYGTVNGQPLETSVNIISTFLFVVGGLQSLVKLGVQSTRLLVSGNVGFPS
ncbi:hypothetical protein P691DRAFT_802579 [Macrolepiota fuliginosa MF-IS2]|uniref:Uncharacterized protein n=1 Tax=Macrolepiota fuliginosa MF-IS2 TaxID=1400762 RepID=A0A9P5XA96_9AGAR|nr:hypothetical protein P691DRAFT_802579 [Macrolepiota fuliginosa MF-IS2]